jgi:hypothetical protein
MLKLSYFHIKIFFFHFSLSNNQFGDNIIFNCFYDLDFETLLFLYKNKKKLFFPKNQLGDV